MPLKNIFSLKDHPIPVISPHSWGRPDFPSSWPSSGYVQITWPKSSKWSSILGGMTKKAVFSVCWIYQSGIKRLPWGQRLSERDANTQWNQSNQDRARTDDIVWASGSIHAWSLNAPCIDSYVKQLVPYFAQTSLCTFSITLNLKSPLSLVTKLCPTLWDPTDCSPPGSSVYGILQARVLEWVAISFSRRSSSPRDLIQVSCIAGRLFTIWAKREAHRALIHSISSTFQLDC